MGKKYVSCSYEQGGKIRTWVKPITPGSMLQIGKIVYSSMPVWFHTVLVAVILLTVFPDLYEWWTGTILLWGGLPITSVLVFAAGTHFWFPRELKKYHGAEHKVFSYRGKVSTINQRHIGDAKITNRHCSTNAIVLYFFTFFMMLVVMLVIGSTFDVAFDTAALTAIFTMPLTTYMLNRTKETSIHRFFIRISYALQLYVTTAKPNDKHLKTAIRSYRRLAFKEFPHKVKGKQKHKTKSKERSNMVIADVSIIPVGKATTSESEQIAKIQDTLQQYEGKISFEVHAMSTVIEAELSVLFEVLQKIHEAPFEDGIQRVATNIRIDDRRDKSDSMKEKEDRVKGETNH